MVFDIGANIGYFHSSFSKLCGKMAKFTLLNQYLNFSKLLQSIESFDNVITTNKAVGDSIGLVNIYYNQNDSEKASLINPDEPYVEKIKIPIITLTPIDENKLERLDLLNAM